MRKRLYFFVVMMLTTICAFAQSLHVKGTVTDENKEPVIGAYVRIKGVDRGALTDVNGKFELKNVKKSDQLVLSFIGMKTITVSPKANMNIIMESNDKVLDEVMVVAFGEQKKSSFTGSADVIDMKLIEQRQVNNVMDALQGSVSGLQSYSHSGAPDANPEFRIRGISSINAGNNPLIVLDGVPYDGEWNSINPADVASVTVLKDAASNALYGARGANGVIIVTTKKGDQNRTTIGLDMKVGSKPRFQALQNHRQPGTVLRNLLPVALQCQYRQGAERLSGPPQRQQHTLQRIGRGRLGLSALYRAGRPVSDWRQRQAQPQCYTGQPRVQQRSGVHHHA